jgi:uncharacterized protein (TIGR02246 family)
MDDDEKSAILQLEASYDAAWQRRDVDGLVECLTLDAVLVSPRGDVARGHHEIRVLLGAFLTGEALGSHHVSEVHRVEFVTDEVAVIDGEAHVVGLPAGGGRHDLVHAFTDVVVRRDGRWLIAHVRAYDRHGTGH